MRLTIDSAEPLDHVLRVIGSMYGTALTVAPDGQTSRAPKKSPSRAAATSKSRRRKAAGPKRSRQRATGPATADVRAWAQENGQPVAGRGRIPDTVLAAYRDAH